MALIFMLPSGDPGSTEVIKKLFPVVKGKQAL